jgi:hypothetical protein
MGRWPVSIVLTMTVGLAALALAVSYASGDRLSPTLSVEIDSFEGRLHNVDGRVVGDDATLDQLRAELAAFESTSLDWDRPWDSSARR